MSKQDIFYKINPCSISLGIYIGEQHDDVEIRVSNCDTVPEAKRRAWAAIRDIVSLGSSRKCPINIGEQVRHLKESWSSQGGTVLSMREEKELETMIKGLVLLVQCQVEEHTR